MQSPETSSRMIPQRTRRTGARAAPYFYRERMTLSKGPLGRASTLRSRAAGKFEELDLPRPAAQVQSCEGNWKMEAARAGAAWIQIKNAVALNAFGFMRVAAHHDVKAGRGGIKVELLAVV